MDKKISDKQVFDLIAEFAKTSDATITSTELKKEFPDEAENNNNSNIVIFPQDQEKEIAVEENKIHQEILPLLNSIHSSIVDLQNVKNNTSIDSQVDEILTFLRNTLDEKIIAIEQKLGEIIFKNQSSKFLLEDTKNILASSKLQQAELEKIKAEVSESSKIFKDHKPFTLEERNELKNDFIKITTTQFQQLEARINKAEATLLKVKDSTIATPLLASTVTKEGQITIPKWFIYVTLVLIATLFALFFYLLNNQSSTQIKASKPSLNVTPTSNTINNIPRPQPLSDVEKETIKEPTPSAIHVKPSITPIATTVIATPVPNQKISIGKSTISSPKSTTLPIKKITSSKNTNEEPASINKKTTNTITTVPNKIKNTNSAPPNDVFFGSD